MIQYCCGVVITSLSNAGGWASADGAIHSEIQRGKSGWRLMMSTSEIMSTMAKQFSKESSRLEH